VGSGGTRKGMGRKIRTRVVKLDRSMIFKIITH